MASESQRHNEGESNLLKAPIFLQERLKYRGAGYPPPISYPPTLGYDSLSTISTTTTTTTRTISRPVITLVHEHHHHHHHHHHHQDHIPVITLVHEHHQQPITVINAKLHQQGCQNSKVIKFLRRHSVNNNILGDVYIYTPYNYIACVAS
ncbi:hypothetical protein OIU84_026256 [Salix udensis]|uniref:Uncharacterized protein n=1 Tax=Salix udensis TaxID=889485 RepID=A0AAD6KLF9_9ROSI|nr:hypothetical protein OIU84_026256 [Salix udensis]